MKKLRTTSWFLILVFLLAAFVSFTLAQETPSAPGGPFIFQELPESLSGQPLSDASEVMEIELSSTRGNAIPPSSFSVSLAPGKEVDGSQDPTIPVDTSINFSHDETGDTCKQLLVNTQLDIVEFGDETGIAEPWSMLIQQIYYTDHPDEVYGGSGFSLWMMDGEDTTPDPDVIDMFGQGFSMPRNLTEIRVEYQRMTLNSNSTDQVYGELYLLDDDWVLHYDNPDYFAAGWLVYESDNLWAQEIAFSDDPALLKEMEGRNMAILLSNWTDGGDGSKEIIVFDNVELFACTKEPSSSGKILMPAVMNNYGEIPDPICRPPTETPPDQWHSDRGLVQTWALCNSKLSNVDRADYYTYKPGKTGKHTLRLTNLPAGTEWSAMIFFDSATPDYAPGSASDGTCRITTPGSVNKQVVCDLVKGTAYFVKVSAGSTASDGSYNMKITTP